MGKNTMKLEDAQKLRSAITSLEGNAAYQAVVAQVGREAGGHIDQIVQQGEENRDWMAGYISGLGFGSWVLEDLKARSQRVIEAHENENREPA